MFSARRPVDVQIIFEAVQRVADDRHVIAAGFGEDQPLPFAMEQLKTKCLLSAFT